MLAAAGDAVDSPALAGDAGEAAESEPDEPLPVDDELAGDPLPRLSVR